MGKPVTWNLYGLLESGVNGVNKPKIIHGSNLPLIRGCTRFVPSFVGTPIVPNRTCLMPSRLLDVDKPILPLVNGGRFV